MLIKKWTHRHALAAGAILILAVNTVALVGVAYNRSGEPDSRLVLSERELRLPDRGWGFESENSGMALHLQWRLPQTKDEMRSFYYYVGYGGTVPWLDQAKLTQLGFDVSRAAEDEKARRYYDKIRPRDVLLVLELAGPAHEAALDYVRRFAADKARLAAANPGEKALQEQARNAQEQLKREESFASRLFVVDAGTELAALRAKYPDRARYAIVGGRVRPTLIEEKKKPRVAGYVETLNISAVNVPLEFRPVFDGMNTERTVGQGAREPRFEAALAFGQRLEPWFTSAARTR